MQHIVPARVSRTIYGEQALGARRVNVVSSLKRAAWVGMLAVPACVAVDDRRFGTTSDAGSQSIASQMVGTRVAEDSADGNGAGFGSGADAGVARTGGSATPTRLNAELPDASDGSFADAQVPVESSPSMDASPEPLDRDTTAPSVVSVSPAAGTSQVTLEQVSLQFSEPMIRSTVESGFPNATAFEWDPQSTRVDIALPLPFSSTPQLFEIAVPATATDLSGNPLGAPVTIPVVLAAASEVALELDSTLTGNQVEGDDGNYTFFEAGDIANGSRLRFAGASFSLSGLPTPSSILGVRRAELRLQVVRVDGNPGDVGLNGLWVDLVSYSARSDIDAPVIVEQAVGQLLTPGELVVGRVLALDVTEQLRSAWTSEGTGIQFRIGPGTSNLDAVSDAVFFRRSADENDGVVDATLPEPDPDPEHLPHIAVQYFH